ncbi:MAG: DeoR faimly transcriptional regulator [Peptococcaceae bacterium BICA1-7]|nr:MAG: DeoR faimly transcriptional regulator [Peptococcaceae bacterium BICA1-7]HBV99519.1 bifunctional diaminohydroxyphosphoribosylaminopyrimidine deaminase/5-amino-6-(5-phosphoribosylamino)uracil reductase RibD [Desulfotomaculum sp.]
MDNSYYMKMALDLAASAMGRTSPNPMVGAVLVKDGKVVGKGYHARAGTPHAEVVALRDAGEAARGSTLYVTLEPCCHHGRTGPCTEAVIEAGVKKVVAAMTDPNPMVAGKGFDRLREAGLEVEAGIMEEDARSLNEVFIKYITTGLPFVVMKAAVSLDGKIATRTGDSQWITGPGAREYGHSLRDRYDAVLVGINTVLADNPSLNTRVPGGGRDPVRVVLDSQARTPPEAKIINSSPGAPVIIITTPGAPAGRLAALEEAGARVEIAPAVSGRVDIKAAFAGLARRGITSILIEGGGVVHASALDSGMVDKVVWFIAPLLIGGLEAPGPLGGEGPEKLAGATALDRVNVSRIGGDILVEGYISRQRG